MWNLLLDRRPTRRFTLSGGAGVGGYRRAVHPTTERALPARPLSRRILLRGAVAAPILVALSGCTSSGGDTETSGSPGGATSAAEPTPTVDPDASARRSAIESARGLVAEYEAALAVPALAATLTPLLAHHRAHLGALDAEVAASPSTSPPTTSVTASPATSPTGPPPTPDTAATLASLGAAETAAADARVADALSAHDGGFARLLASIAACSRVHAAVLASGPPADGAA
jgi:hypothetical protein